MQHTDLDTTVLDERLAAAKESSYRLARATTAEKNAALEQVAVLLRAASGEIITANALDLAAGREAGLATGLLDRLTLDERRVDALAEAVLEVISLTDPIGETV
ncbi:MAG TPA: gamma-glutamyl-phosphate reductase, partial [Agromyces sp.]|nr:gamma-glutamyl-phosphate reductase [Agromyces sp.]